jgi:sigma-B regulation protein RsbU (phosphoserine phosphatase)
VSLLEPKDQAFVEQLSELLAGQAQPDITGALDQVGEYLAVEAISIFVVDSDTGELVLTHAADPVGQELVGLRLSPGQGVVGWVTKYNEDLIVPSTDLDPRFYSGVDAQSGFVTRSILCVPMAMSGRVVGAIEAMNKATGHFNADDVVLLQQVANTVVQYI